MQAHHPVYAIGRKGTPEAFQPCVTPGAPCMGLRTDDTSPMYHDMPQLTHEMRKRHKSWKYHIN